MRWYAAVAGAILVVAAVAWMGPYLMYVGRTSNPAWSGVMPLAATLVFFALCGLNAYRQKSGKEPFLSAGETLAIFFIIMMGSWAGTWGFVQAQMPLLTSPAVFASPENSWAERILPYLPKWAMGPMEAPWPAAFYNGLPVGETMPWKLWMGPVFAWSCFAVALALFSIALGGVLSKQWIENDRLTFPHAEVLMGMVGGWLRNPLFWIGVGVAAAQPTYSIIQRFLTVLPPVSLDFGGGSPDGIEWMAGIGKEGWFKLSLNFTMVGLLYFVHRDIIISVIIFFFVAALEGYGIGLAGWNPQHADLYGLGNTPVGMQGAGALFMFVLWGLWSSRKWLGEYFKSAFTGKNRDASWVSPRLTVAMLAIGLVALVAWMAALGLRGPGMIPFLLAKVVSYIGGARILAESSLDGGGGLDPVDFVVVFGTRWVAPAGFVALAISYCWISDLGSNGSSLTTRSLQGEKLNTLARFPAGTLAFILLAVAVATVCAMYGTAYTAYNHGANNFGGWDYQWHTRIMYDRATECSRTPVGVDFPRLGWMGFGMALMGGLIFLRNNVVGWFLHPVGFLVGAGAKAVVFNAALVWIIKTATLKMGGVEGYEKYKPLFAGLVVGNFIPWMAGVVIDPIFFLHRGRALG